MDYREYRAASERHLDTCLSIKNIIENKYSGQPLDAILEKEKQEHLFNIYYLGGYILECCINYAILKFINFDNIATQCRLNSFKQLRSDHNSFNVSFRNKNAAFALWQPAHKFQPNIHFFAIGNKLSGIDHIRGINGNPITPLHVRKLFNEWSVEYRYETKNQILNSSEVFDFLDFAHEVYTGLEHLGY